MSNHFIYPIVVENADDGGYGLYFPDFPGTAVLAKDVADGIRRAKEMLVFRILEIEEKGATPPQPSVPEAIEDLETTDRVVYVEVFMPPYRDEAANKAVTKNCTLPKWLRDAAEDAGLNFSQILQSGLKEALGIEKHHR